MKIKITKKSKNPKMWYNDCIGQVHEVWSRPYPDGRVNTLHKGGVLLGDYKIVKEQNHES